MDKKELETVQAYLRSKFGNQTLRAVPLPKKKDSAEIYLGEEFIGVLYRDDEDGELSYSFNMAILAEDLQA